MSDSLVPRDHAEAVALFRAEIIGGLARCQLDRGELAAELRKLAERKYRPPGRRTTKQYGVSTLERWVYAYRRVASRRSAPTRAPTAGALAS